MDRQNRTRWMILLSKTFGSDMRRRVRLIFSTAESSDIRIKIWWHGDCVYHGVIHEHIEWDTESAVWGDIPLVAEITGTGSVTWLDLHMNYSGCELCLPGSESSGHRRVHARDFFAAPSVKSDCRNSVKINGDVVDVDRDAETAGAWHYDITAPARIEALIRVDRQKTQLWQPVV